MNTFSDVVVVLLPGTAGLDRLPALDSGTFTTCADPGGLCSEAPLWCPLSSCRQLQVWVRSSPNGVHHVLGMQPTSPTSTASYSPPGSGSDRACPGQGRVSDARFFTENVTTRMEFWSLLRGDNLKAASQETGMYPRAYIHVRVIWLSSSPTPARLHVWYQILC